VKRALQGRLDLLGPARRAQEAVLAPSDTRAEGRAAGPLVAEAALVDGARQVTLLLAGAAVQRFGTDLEEQQELLAGLADLVTGVLTMDSAVVRARQAASETDLERAERHVDLARVVVADRIAELELRARSLAGSLAEGDEARLLVSGVRRLLRADPVDRIALARRVASHVLAAGGYPV
jgi:hypothetical protein